MSTPNVQTPVIKINANETRQVSIAGQYFACQATTAPFQMSIDGGPFISITAGIAFPTTKPWTNLVLRDTLGGGFTTTLFIGDQGVQYFPPNITTVVTDALTYIKATPSFAIANGAWSEAFTGVDTGGKIRKHFTASNLDGASTLHIGDGTNPGMAIPPGLSRIIATSGSLKIFNAGVAPANCEVLEVFYA